MIGFYYIHRAPLVLKSQLYMRDAILCPAP